MKRLLAALAALLIAGSAEARTLVALDRNIAYTDAATTKNGKSVVAERSTAITLGFLNRFNPNGFDVVNIDAIKLNATGSPTEQLRTGVVNGVTYSSIIIPNYYGGNLAQRAITSCWACSLTMVAKHPTVPILMIGAGLGESAFATGTTVACSTGAAGDQMDPSSQSQAYAAARAVLVGTNYAWNSFGNPGAHVEPATVAGLNGSFRVVVGNVGSCLETGVGGETMPNGSNNCSFRDSLLSLDASCSQCGTAGGGQGALVWMRYPVNGSYTASPMIFCRWQSHALTGRGGSNDPGDQTSVGGDPALIYAAVALLDSLDSNRVLGTSKPDPIKLAFQIDGAGYPGTSTEYDGGFASADFRGGYEPSDTTAVYATLDSMTARKIKATFGVDLVQMIYGSSQRDAIKLNAMPYSRFTPQTLGILSAATMLRRANFRNPRDLFGYSRKRATGTNSGVFYSPGSADASTALYGADSSVYALAKGSFFLVDSIFGVGRRGTVAMPPYGDWASDSLGKQYGATQSMDSLMFALAAAGFTGISSDAEGDTLSSATGYPAALGSGQRVVNNRFGSGGAMNFLTYPGRFLGTLDSGSGSNFPGIDDCHEGAYFYRAMVGLVLPNWMFDEKDVLRTGENGTCGETGRIASGSPGLFGGISKKANINTGVNIMRFSMADLGSGYRQRGTTSADRPGYWAMVHMSNAFAAINQLAGRSLFQVVWDHEIGPRDIRR